MKTLLAKTFPVACALLGAPLLGCGVDEPVADADESVTAAEVAAPVLTEPANGAVGVLPNATIRITFDRPVNPATANIEHVRLIPVGERYEADRIALSLDASRRVLTVTPTSALQGRYRVEIRGIRTDRATIKHSFTFTALHNETTRVDAFFDGEPSFTERTQLDGEGRERRRNLQWADEPVSTRADFAYGPRGGLPALETWFNAGPDGVFNTADDGIDTHTISQFDDLGFPTRVTTLGSGPDGRMNTSDDVIEQYDSYLRVGDTTWVTYWVDDPGQDGIWFTADDRADRVERFDLDAAGRGLKQTIYTAPGPDGLWRTADDLATSISDTIYTAAYIDGVTHDAGDDEIFGTPDDAEWHSRTTINPAGNVSATISYEGPGADDTWGTEDDAISFVMRSEPVSRFPRDQKMLIGPGADGRWGTPDDELYRVFRYDLAASGARKQRLELDDAGPDGVWFTADDVIGSVIAYNPNR